MCGEVVKDSTEGKNVFADNELLQVISYSRHSVVTTALNLSAQDEREDGLGVPFATVQRSLLKGLKGSSLERRLKKRGKLSSGHSGVSVGIY